ncbi:ammonia-dependent NAD(+) synthetase [Ramlibacter rhizophilus]|uniref:NH(3)-dependent NAD(+) synthetase n=1 Tax=Ramlibacter rhizophilus TaxID=1781167 RepID=A0A4Z0BFJ8_9BURK|nr:ammonia-dependent NAD(+) synthetase [Ramlibacter rhizophilus]TFY97461.1 ammonia-dependent NAD(+) synthetase [Ramlibacter rhizophilus]
MPHDFNAETIAAELLVSPQFDAATEAQRRIDFLSSYLATAGMDSLVLGISGGVDSTTAGRLCQLAVERLRSQGRSARFIAMRLPYGEQRDEDDAQLALQFIQPDETLFVDILPAVQGLAAGLRAGPLAFDSPAQEDFVMGNIKARQRMVAQYAVAGARRGLVVGTDHAAEAVMGFFTKYGDGACDVAPLTGLNKRRVRAIAAHLGAPQGLVEKVPTADLEELRPQLPDEAAYGISYGQIDDFLEGKPVPQNVVDVIRRFYMASRHKRALPAHPPAQS